MSDQRLAAILFSDIVGYSRLMGSDQNLAMSLVEEVRLVHQEYILKNNGLLHKEMGDGFMATFPSASQACQCALDLMRECSKSDKLKLHIGVHLGEIIFRNNDIYGDGVNIASRIQSKAAPGQILITESVYLNMKNNSSFRMSYREELKLKNIDEKYRVYEVLSDRQKISAPIKTGSHKRIYTFLLFLVLLAVAAFSIKYITSGDLRGSDEIVKIAVLPFHDLSETESRFSEGLAYEIRTKLAKIHGFQVRSAISSSHAASVYSNAAELGKILNVTHVLEGSIQLFEDNIHFNLFLTNIKNDESVPIELVDFPVEDMNKAQVMIALEVSKWLDQSLTGNEMDNVSRIPTDNLEAHRNYLLGLHELNKGPARVPLMAAENYFKQAIKQDSQYAEALVALAETYAKYGMYGYMDNRESNKLIEQYATEAIQLDPHSTAAHLAKALILFHDGKPKEALSELDQAILDDPGNDEIYFQKFRIYVWWNDVNHAEDLITTAYQLNPLSTMYHLDKEIVNMDYNNIQDVVDKLSEIVRKDSFNYYAKWHIGLLYILKKDFEPAIEMLKLRKVDSLNNNWLLGYAFAKTGNSKEARRILNYLKEKNDTTYVPPSMIAYIYWGLDEEEEAIQWMRKAYEVQDNFPIMNHAFKVMENESWFTEWFNLGTIDEPRDPYLIRN